MLKSAKALYKDYINYPDYINDYSISSLRGFYNNQEKYTEHPFEGSFIALHGRFEYFKNQTYNAFIEKYYKDEALDINDPVFEERLAQEGELTQHAIRQLIEGDVN